MVNKEQGVHDGLGKSSLAKDGPGWLWVVGMVKGGQGSSKVQVCFRYASSMFQECFQPSQFLTEALFSLCSTVGYDCPKLADLAWKSVEKKCFHKYFQFIPNRYKVSIKG